ncbi:M24 family metallopeptidase [Paracidobacterium acidisoli]|uniref:M24 family metallopeptidase n=1 Tax=Paracidobacterium acidisoli TaxID=2303751 RepID=A0A372IQ53_9BACT|nr:aminopeptidase P family protein [Paracidobacterium acidisoli]MBT9331221.1 M24 family metallopeptidase [Paracidobacterium acidisoli]
MQSAQATPAPAPAIADNRLEIAEKEARLAAFLDRNGLSAVLLARHPNLAWITAGQVEARVGGGDAAVCSVLLTRDGRRYCITPANEAPRMAAEEFNGLFYEPVLYPWIADRTAELARELAGDGKIGSDLPREGFETVNLASLRTPLLAPEIDRFHALGAKTAEITTQALQDLEPGVTEDEMAARVAAALLAVHITPTVLLMAVDERIYRYKHAVPRGAVLKRYGMLNLCARQHGLIVSITRFVHFGAPPAELAANFVHSAAINAKLHHATRKGATASEIYTAAERAYAEAGAAEDIALHHQGGAAGYGEREWLITPGATTVVEDPEVFAYNPSLRGAKAEDTVVLRNGAIELLTATPELPFIETEVGGRVYRSADLLVR